MKVSQLITSFYEIKKTQTHRHCVDKSDRTILKEYTNQLVYVSCPSIILNFTKYVFLLLKKLTTKCSKNLNFTFAIMFLVLGCDVPKNCPVQRRTDIQCNGCEKNQPNDDIACSTCKKEERKKWEYQRKYSGEKKKPTYGSFSRSSYIG